MRTSTSMDFAVFGRLTSWRSSGSVVRVIDLRRTPWVWLLRVSIAILLLGAAGSIAVSNMSFATAKEYVDGSAVDPGQGLTAARFEEVRGRFVLAAGLCLYPAI